MDDIRLGCIVALYYRSFRFTPYLLTYSVLLFLKRQRDRTLGKPADYVWLTASATGARSALP